ncbi:MAG: nitrite reductase large subunit NirB [Actinomycetota bacterium]|nr:nitrite reductase large subunit NirB [Actinomycetota bacterium]
MTSERPTLVVIGNGMVGFRFLEEAVDQRLAERFRIVVFGDEPRPAYDRVHLSSFFDDDAPELELAGPTWYEAHGIELRLGARITALDPGAKTVTDDTGAVLRYERCVLATGSYPFVPPVSGVDAAGVFVYRTIDDLEAMRAWSIGCTTAAVVGGGLLGLEAANAMRQLGLRTTVVELAPRLMAVQLDEGGGESLRRKVEALGIEVRTGAGTTAVRTTPDGRALGLDLGEDQPALDAELVVFAAGIRPRDQLAREAGLAVGERGGVVVDDAMATSDPAVLAIGEVACHDGRVHGLVAPGYEMASVAARRLAGDPAAAFRPTEPATKLKLLGVDVAVAGRSIDTQALVVDDPVTGTYRKLVLDDDGAVTGLVLVGDAGPFAALSGLALSRATAPDNALELLLGTADAGDAGTICSCHNVSGTAIREAIRAGDLEDLGAVKACTKAGTGCGSCVTLVNRLLTDELQRAGKEVDRGLCEHFTQTRQELFEIVRVTGIRTFAELTARFGSGRGCAVCKPTVASMFASLASGYVLDGEQASLQDTNDHFLANIQRDGTYSVVPRVPGGEITPAGLIAIGEVARDFDLYTKITGGQRIDLFGATVDQLPEIWRRLIDAGFESGHAYGKAVRTVKSCIGSTWCRYGVQDSVQLAIDLELRYRGLRAPHKIKLAVSGCARECAEAQGKDVGVIATERGWNMYVGGNGGMRPRHADLLAEDLSTEELVRAIDRFLMYYVRTADRLERTATWLEKLEGGLDHVKAVVLEDSLGIGTDLDADMARHVENYECEWKATLADPDRAARFRSFANTDDTDPTLAYVRVRGQRQPT